MDETPQLELFAKDELRPKKKAPKKIEPDPVFNALAALYGIRNERGKLINGSHLGKIIKDLRANYPSTTTPENVRHKAKALKRQIPTAGMNCLLKMWTRLPEHKPEQLFL